MKDNLLPMSLVWNRKYYYAVGFSVNSGTDGFFRLVDEITYKQAAASSSSATPSAILGPFWRHDAPVRKNGESIILKTPSDGKVAYFYGRLTDGNTGKPLSNALVDVWQASTNGKPATFCEEVSSSA